MACGCGCNKRSCCGPVNAYSYLTYYWPNACGNNGINSACGYGYWWNW